MKGRGFRSRNRSRSTLGPRRGCPAGFVGRRNQGIGAPCGGNGRRALQDSGLPTGALDLEVTESVVLDCGEEGIERLRVLRAAGVGVALDDFGTGYSSLGNLRTLPIDQLKVDRSFVSEMLAGGVESAVVEAVVRLGAALGVSVVAEGIEDPAVAERLAELGCPLGQGFLFGRPQPVAQLSGLFLRPLGRRPTQAV